MPWIPVVGRSSFLRTATPSPWHTHNGCIELVYCKHGTCDYESRGKTYRLTPGRVFVSRTNEAHRMMSNPKGLATYYLLFKVPERNAEGLLTNLLGVTNGWPVQLSSPLRFFVKESPGQKVLARFTQDGTAAVVERRTGGCKYVYVAAFGGLSAEYFHHLAEESGAYVPTDGHGLEVNMNGDFVSVHCLRGGHYDFRLPFKATVTNLKTGREVPESATSIPMDLTPGETRWYGLSAPRTGKVD